MRVLICGAGVAGLALARQLPARGCDVVVLERADRIRPEGYMIDFFGPGFEAAEAMGLLPELVRRSYVVDEVAYVDQRGRTTARLDYGRMRRALDGRLLSLLRGDLVESLAEGLDRRVDLRFGRSVETLRQADDVMVTLSDGSRLDVDLVVGADGIHSGVRRLAFGPEGNHLRFIGLHTSAYTFEDFDLHRRLGSRFVITDSSDRVVGLYGLRNGRVAVFTAHRATESRLPDDPRATVRGRYGDLGWIVPDVLVRCPEPPALYYDVVAQICMPTWSDRRVVVTGDAAYAVSLLAGQGASLAAAGAHVLATELGSGATLGEALRRYEHRLSPVVLQKQAAGRRAARWFLPSSPLRLLLRRLAVRGTRLPVVSRRISGALAAGSGRIP